MYKSFVTDVRIQREGQGSSKELDHFPYVKDMPGCFYCVFCGALNTSQRNTCPIVLEADLLGKMSLSPGTTYWLYSGGQVDFIMPLFHYFRKLNEMHPDKHAGVWAMYHTPMSQGIHPRKCEVFPHWLSLSPEVVADCILM